MQKTPGFNRRLFCGAATATVAAGSLGLSGFLSSERSKAMNAVVQQTGSDKTAIRPFRVNVSEAELTELRKRINATKWPERETVADASQGVQLATIQKLARYWATDYDWRKCEAKLNALPQFITEIDGLDIHFIHVRSKHENALPLIVTHGWPGSVVEQLKIVGPLTDPTAHGGSAVGRFRRGDPVDAGLRLLRQADHDRLGPRPHRPCLDRADEAPRIHAGSSRKAAIGVRSSRSRWACRRRRNCSASTPTCLPPYRPKSSKALASHSPPPGLSADERYAFERLDFFFTHGLAYAQEMASRPQTLYAIADSPVGLAAWFLDHDARSYELIARVFDGQTRRPHAGRRSRQHHAHLADQHGDFRGSSLSGEQASLLRPDGRHHPHCRERLSRRALSSPAELGGAGVSQAHPLQQAPKRRALCGLGTAETLFRRGSRGLQTTAQIMEQRMF